MKRILIFSTAYLPFIGGAELAIKEITDRMPEYDFFMITTRFSRSYPAHERIGRIEVYRVGIGLSSFFDKLMSPVLGMMQARSLMKRYSFSLFWSMMVSFTSMAPVFLKIFHVDKKIPLLLTLQEGDSETHLTYAYGGLLFVMWKLALRYADGVQVISRYLRQLAVQRGARTPHIYINPNGVAFSHFAQTYSFEELEKAKEKFGKKPGDVLIVTTSRLVLKNAVDDGITALRYLPSRVKFLIFGKGPLEEKLKALARNLKVDDRVIFAGEIAHADMPLYLQMSDIYLRPSLSEGLGSSFLEAMAAGIPVIATEVGGIPDFLTDRVTGLFCRVRSPKDIAEKVMELIKNDELRNGIIWNAKKMVKEKYDWNTAALSMNEIFKKCILNS